MRAASSGGQTEQLDALVKKDKVVVFLKGTPEQPQCGFSNAVVQILRLHGVRDYAAYNVLDDPELRQGIKDYSNWPTIPQVYLNGEFVGGCDNPPADAPEWGPGGGTEKAGDPFCPDR